MAHDTAAADNRMAVVQVLASFRAPNASFAFSEPAARCHLLLCEKLHPFLALHMQIAKEGIAPAGEWEPSHGSRHADINPDHACFHSVLKFACRFSRARKNGSAVAVGGAVNCFDRIVRGHQLASRLAPDQKFLHARLPSHFALHRERWPQEKSRRYSP